MARADLADSRGRVAEAVLGSGEQRPGAERMRLTGSVSSALNDSRKVRGCFSAGGTDGRGAMVARVASRRRAGEGRRWRGAWRWGARRAGEGRRAGGVAGFNARRPHYERNSTADPPASILPHSSSDRLPHPLSPTAPPPVTSDIACPCVRSCLFPGLLCTGPPPRPIVPFACIGSGNNRAAAAFGPYSSSLSTSLNAKPPARRLAADPTYGICCCSITSVLPLPSPMPPLLTSQFNSPAACCLLRCLLFVFTHSSHASSAHTHQYAPSS